jgi:hypothetical protein
MVVNFLSGCEKSESSDDEDNVNAGNDMDRVRS